MNLEVLDKAENGIHYSVGGTGQQTIVLLRGLARWSAHWLGFEDLVIKQGFRVITIDNRGFGKSAGVRIEKDTTIHELADDVAQIISREAPAGAHIVGLSLGAMVGLALATMKPQLVRSLMMVNSSVGGSGIARLSPKALLAIARALVSKSHGYGALSRALLSPHAGDAKLKRLATEWKKIDIDANIQMIGLWRQLVAARKFLGFVEMSAISCPTTIVRCDQDQFVDPRNSDFIHKQISHSDLIRHSNAGHELAIDDPDWFVEQIKMAVDKAASKLK
jgi:pimeloyl-ACP methyl ester carboxylesterase